MAAALRWATGVDWVGVGRTQTGSSRCYGIYLHFVLKYDSHLKTVKYMSPELQCLLKVKEDVSIGISTCYIKY